VSRISDALAQIELARKYTRELLDTFAEDEWFKMPSEGVTHLAWQVGHLASAEYFLCLTRARGFKPEDLEFITPEFRKTFGRGSEAVPDPAAYPSVAAIRATFDRVHEQVLREVPTFDDADLDGPIDPPHRICKTKIECLRWCALHEMTHAGQIGLLRRLFGHAPVW
jgi:hypothetical protein